MELQNAYTILAKVWNVTENVAHSRLWNSIANLGSNYLLKLFVQIAACAKCEGVEQIKFATHIDGFDVTVTVTCKPHNGDSHALDT